MMICLFVYVIIPFFTSLNINSGRTSSCPVVRPHIVIVVLILVMLIFNLLLYVVEGGLEMLVAVDNVPSRRCISSLIPAGARLDEYIAPVCEGVDGTVCNVSLM